MTTLVLAAVVQATVLAGPADDRPIAKADARPDAFTLASQRSIKTGRPLVVLLGADWCPACKVMKKTTLPKLAEAGGLKDVEFAYVDVDRQRRLAGRLIRGNSIPQLIRFDKTEKGWKSQYLIGSQSVKKIAEFVEVSPPDPPIRLSSWLQETFLPPKR
ncbi:MAG: thioredoxin family protein [Pirellulales bacterium]|nr:thioredoxin family protein [Pirellulales bacterium]